MLSILHVFLFPGICCYILLLYYFIYFKLFITSILHSLRMQQKDVFFYVQILFFELIFQTIREEKAVIYLCMFRCSISYNLLLLFRSLYIQCVYNNFFFFIFWIWCLVYMFAFYVLLSFSKCYLWLILSLHRLDHHCFTSLIIFINYCRFYIFPFRLVDRIVDLLLVVIQLKSILILHLYF